MSDGPDFGLSDLTSAVEGKSSVGIGNYSGAIAYCDTTICVMVAL